VDKKNTQKREMLVKQLIAKYQTQTKELKDLQESFRTVWMERRFLPVRQNLDGRQKSKSIFAKPKRGRSVPESIPGDQQEDNSMSSPAKKAN
jgi:hypothetical protein